MREEVKGVGEGEDDSEVKETGEVRGLDVTPFEAILISLSLIVEDLFSSVSLSDAAVCDF